MRVLLFLLACGAALLGGSVFLQAPSIMQEIAGLLLFLIAAVLFTASAVIDAITHRSQLLLQRLERLQRDRSPPAAP